MSVIHVKLDQSTSLPIDTLKSPAQSVQEIKSASQLDTESIATLKSSLHESDVLTPGSDLYAEKSKRWATSSERRAVSRMIVELNSMLTLLLSGCHSARYLIS